ncbi:hypothetical protein [Paenibacillus sp. YN15]|uniref:hypothetical protein n=1 Tax=Paenibacillus sp. YN15 TaxID=1742774 RepID=UPI0011BF172C|nr:hypothetical protein [Paenibacillus sp. YN15]
MNSEPFLRYQKYFAQRLAGALVSGYLGKGSTEPKLVKIIEHIVQNLDGFHTKGTIDPYSFEISTNALFIHGNKSQVTFDCYGRQVQRELGDLIFIVSLVFQNAKYVEKVTINQFKKAKEQTRIRSWDIRNKEQLYLLSKFPEFQGVQGSYFSGPTYLLPNISGCLGSYGLLHAPGDFVFIGAELLDSFINPRKSAILQETHLSSLQPSSVSYLAPCLDVQSRNVLMNYVFETPELLSLEMFYSHRFAYDLFDFSKKYLALGIGEPVHMIANFGNQLVKTFLGDLLGQLYSSCIFEEDKPVRNFIENFYTHPYSGDERKYLNTDSYCVGGLGSVGIIHTEINIQ